MSWLDERVAAGHSTTWRTLLRCCAAQLVGQADVEKTPAEDGYEEIAVVYRCAVTGERAMRVRLGSAQLGTRTSSEILLPE